MIWSTYTEAYTIGWSLEECRLGRLLSRNPAVQDYKAITNYISAPCNTETGDPPESTWRHG